MDHASAARTFDALAGNLDAAGRHLVGPGFEFARLRLTDAARNADALADIHRAAARHDLPRAYVADLLGPDAVAGPPPA